MKRYIDSKKKLYNAIMKLLWDSGEMREQNFLELFKNISYLHIEKDREEMPQFLITIKSISDQHHRDANFIQSIEEILQHYKEQIKQTLSNDEIFHIFEDNKLLVLFLLKNGTISISESIYDYMVCKNESNGNRYCHFFYPELSKFKGEEKMKSIKEELLSLNPTAFEEYENKRQEGENDSYICSLIRNDSVEEFISYINRQNISVSSEIKPSIFETNLFLIENRNTTLIEYSAFFGSIRIFRYLMMNNVKLTPSLWIFSIHSKNSELFQLLESNKEIFSKEDFNYLPCFIESIKCHHNDFSEYIKDNLIQEQEIESTKIKEEILSNYIKYHNYAYFQTDDIKEQGFFYLCLYNYERLVELLLTERKKEIENKIILKDNIFINEELVSTIKI